MEPRDPLSSGYRELGQDAQKVVTRRSAVILGLILKRLAYRESRESAVQVERMPMDERT